MKWFVAFLLWCPSVWASDVIRCDPSDPLVPNRVVRHFRSTQTNVFLSDPNDINSVLDDILLHASPPPSNNAWDGVVPSGSMRYWKCIDTNGDAVVDSVRVMTIGEKAVLDVPQVAEQARRQRLRGEIRANFRANGLTNEQIDLLMENR